MPSKNNRIKGNFPPVGTHEDNSLQYLNKAFVGFKDEEQRQEGEELKREEEEKARPVKEEKKLIGKNINEQVAENRWEMQKMAFDHLAALRKEEENQITKLERARQAQNVEREKVVASENMKLEDEKIGAMVENRKYNVYLREEKSQRDLQEKKTRRVWVVERDEALEAKKKKLEEELWKFKEPTIKESQKATAKALTPYKDTKEEGEDIPREEEDKARQAKGEDKWMQRSLVNEQVTKKRQERQQIAFNHLAAIKKEEEDDMAQLEQERYARDMEKHNAVEAVKKKEEEERKAATFNNRDYNFYLRERKSQRDLQEKKTRRAWVVEKDEALEAEKKREEELREKQKQLQCRDNKEYREIISKAFLLYKDKEQQDQEREQMKAEEEAKARQAREEEKKRIQRSLNNKQIFKNREKMQKITYDHLAAIRKEEESQVAQLERSRHARDMEKDKAEEAEKKQEEEEKRAALVKNRKYNVYLREVKSQQNLQEKKTRRDWVVEMDEALEAEKKREGEPRKKEKPVQDTKEYQESIPKAFIPYKERERQGQERERLKREKEAKARQAREEEQKRLQMGIKCKEVVKIRQEMQQIAFDHLAAIRKEEESQVAQLERSRHARDMEKDKVGEAEKKQEEEEKRAARVKNRKYNVYLREVKSQREQQRRKP